MSNKNVLAVEGVPERWCVSSWGYEDATITDGITKIKITDSAYNRPLDQGDRPRRLAVKIATALNTAYSPSVDEAEYLVEIDENGNVVRVNKDSGEPKPTTPVTSVEAVLATEADGQGNVCPNVSERTASIREQQRSGGGEITAVMVSRPVGCLDDDYEVAVQPRKRQPNRCRALATR